MSTRGSGASRLAFVDFHQHGDGSWSLVFESPGDPDSAQRHGRASTPRLALYAALQALETRAGGLARARAELERLEGELAQRLRRAS